MYPSRFFWAAFLIAFGLILLLERLNVFFIDWSALWRFWPLILVFWGVAILARGKPFAPALAGLAGVILAAMIAAAADWTFGIDLSTYEHPETTQQFAQPFDTAVRRGSFQFVSGAGTFSVEGTTDQLLQANVKAEFGRYVMRGERIEQSEDVSLKMEGERKPWTFSRSGNRVMLRFNPAVPWDMRFTVGASRIDLDLSPFAIERATVEAGASQVRIRLGDRADETRLSVSSGVSTVRILLPRASACEISADSPLSRKSFRDFVRSDEGTYRTENFASAPKRVFIDLKSGVSNLTVVRY